MTQARRITVALLAATLALTAVGCGGSSKHKTASSTSTAPVTTTTTTDTTTTGNGKTSTTDTGRKSKKKRSTTDTGKTTTSTTPKPPPLSQTPARVLRYAGTGVLELGTVRIPKDATIKWTNDGQLFQIIPASVKVQSPVNSMAHSGTAQIKKGAYHGFLVNAVGHWTVVITPN